MFWAKLALVGVAVLIGLLNAFTTRRLWSSPALERPQKIAQTVLLWLIPGSAFVVRHLLDEPSPGRPGDPTVTPLDPSTDLSAMDHNHGSGHHSD